MTSFVANNQYWLLNSVTDWRTSTQMESLLQHADGTLTLQTLPGEAQPFTPDPTTLLACPSAVATDPCNGTYVLDTAAARVVQIARDGTIRTLIEFGGPGTDAGRFAAPRGLALVHGRIVVSDTGNHRVQVFSPSPFCLIQLWGKTDGGPGSGNMEFKYPWGTAADASGNIYVVDRGNGRVQKIALDGTWLSVIGDGELQDPTEIAVSPDGTVAVIDGAAGDGGGNVKVFARNASQSAILPTVIRPQALAYDPDGNLYVGSATGLVYHFAQDSSGNLNSGGLKYVGAGVTGLATAAVHLAWTAWQADQKQLIGIFQDSTGARQLWFIPSESSFVSSGTFATGILDSGIEGCLWDRVTLMGKIPQGTSVKVEYFSAENANPPTVNLVPNPEDGEPYTFSKTSESAAEASGNSGTFALPDALGPEWSERQWTCLVQCSPAQLLRLRFTFQSAGHSTPAISAIKVFFFATQLSSISARHLSGRS